MYVILNNRKRIYGEDERAIVKAMARRDHVTADPEEYMNKAAARIKEQSGIDIHFTNPKTFLEELRRINLITTID